MWGLTFLRDPVSHILTHNPHTRTHTNPTRRRRGKKNYLISLALGQWRSSMFGVLGLYDHRPPTTAMMHHPENVETKRCRKDFSPKLQRQKRPGPQMAQTPFRQKPGSKLSNPFCSLHTTHPRPPTRPMMHHPETVEAKRYRKDFSPKMQRQKRPAPQMAQTPFGQKPGNNLSNPFCSLHNNHHRPPTTTMMHHPETVETKRYRKEFSPKLKRQKRPAPQMAQTPFGQKPGSKLSNPFCSLHTTHPRPPVAIDLAEGSKLSLPNSSRVELHRRP